MSLVSVAELREALGIGALYDDADLQQCLDTADALILGLLVQDVYNVTHWSVESDVVTLECLTPHGFIVGQTVAVAGVHSALNGNRTITEVTEYTVTFHHNHANQDRIKILPNGTVGIAADYSTTPAVLEAALMTAADVYQSRFATNGQPVGVDFTPAPYRMGRSLVSRVKGLLAPYIGIGTLVG